MSSRNRQKIPIVEVSPLGRHTDIVFVPLEDIDDFLGDLSGDYNLGLGQLTAELGLLSVKGAAKAVISVKTPAPAPKPAPAPAPAAKTVRTVSSVAMKTDSAVAKAAAVKPVIAAKVAIPAPPPPPPPKPAIAKLGIVFPTDIGAAVEKALTPKTTLSTPVAISNSQMEAMSAAVRKALAEAPPPPPAPVPVVVTTVTPGPVVKLPEPIMVPASPPKTILPNVVMKTGTPTAIAAAIKPAVIAKKIVWPDAVMVEEPKPPRTILPSVMMKPDSPTAKAAALSPYIASKAVDFSMVVPVADQIEPLLQEAEPGQTPCIIASKKPARAALFDRPEIADRYAKLLDPGNLTPEQFQNEVIAYLKEIEGNPSNKLLKEKLLRLARASGVMNVTP